MMLNGRSESHGSLPLDKPASLNQKGFQIVSLTYFVHLLGQLQRWKCLHLCQLHHSQTRFSIQTRRHLHHPHQQTGGGMHKIMDLHMTMMTMKRMDGVIWICHQIQYLHWHAFELPRWSQSQQLLLPKSQPSLVCLLTFTEIADARINKPMFWHFSGHEFVSGYWDLAVSVRAYCTFKLILFYFFVSLLWFATKSVATWPLFGFLKLCIHARSPTYNVNCMNWALKISNC